MCAQYKGLDVPEGKNKLHHDSIFNIFTLFKDKHSENALYPIDVTLSGMVIDVRDEQLENALSPIVLTLFGMDIDFRFEQL